MDSFGGFTDIMVELEKTTNKKGEIHNDKLINSI